MIIYGALKCFEFFLRVIEALKYLLGRQVEWRYLCFGTIFMSSLRSIYCETKRKAAVRRVWNGCGNSWKW